MSLDYKYSGSSGYARFEEELCNIAKLFGGVETKLLNDCRDKSHEDWISSMFGFMDENNINNRFVFPDNAEKIIVKWFNDVFGDYTKKETKEIFNIFSLKKEEIKEISPQIWNELEQCVENNDSWYVF